MNLTTAASFASDIQRRLTIGPNLTLKLLNFTAHGFRGYRTRLNISSGFTIIPGADGEPAELLINEQEGVSQAVLLGGSEGEAGITAFAIDDGSVARVYKRESMTPPLVESTMLRQWRFGITIAETQAYVEFDAPTIESIALDNGDVAGGEDVVISGTGFRIGLIVTFDALPATQVDVVSENEIQCLTPAHGSGFVDVVVTNGDGQSGTLSNGYEYTSEE